MSSDDECTRPSLGRLAKIGDLYDVRNEKLMLSNIFNDNIDKFITTTPTKTNLVYDRLYSTKTSDKIRKIGIDGDASLSLLCGIISGSGSFDFVKDKVCSERAVQCSIIVTKFIKEERLNFKQAGLKEYFEMSGHEHATHVVVGISWGAKATITYTNWNFNGHDKNKLTGKMSVELKKIQEVCPQLGDASSHLNASREDNDEWKEEETKISVYTDVPPPDDQRLPETIEEAKKFIDPIRTETEGRQQTFYLLPIVSLLSYIKMNTTLDVKFASITPSRIQKYENLFDEFEENLGQMRDICFDINRTMGVKPQTKHIFQSHLRKMTDDVAINRDDIRELVKNVRSTVEDSSKLDEKYDELEEASIASNKNFNEFLTANRTNIERAKFLLEFEEKGASTAWDDCRLEEIKRNNLSKNLYILFLSFEKDGKSDKINTFCKQMEEKKSQDHFIVVDTDIWEGKEDASDVPETASIQLFIDGKIVDQEFSENTTAYMKKKEMAVSSLEKMLQIRGNFNTQSSEFLTIPVACCVEIDNFTNQPLIFCGKEERRGYFIFDTENKDVGPGQRFRFVTRKTANALFGVEVMAAWKYKDILIAACWQVPYNRGSNTIAVGLTNKGIKFEEVTQSKLSPKAIEGYVYDYIQAARSSGLFEVIYGRTILKGIENETVKNNEIKVKMRMSKTFECHLSLQVFPRNINGYSKSILQKLSQ